MYPKHLRRPLNEAHQEITVLPLRKLVEAFVAASRTPCSPVIPVVCLLDVAAVQVFRAAVGVHRSSAAASVGLSCREKQKYKKLCLCKNSAGLIKFRHVCDYLDSSLRLC